MMKTLRSEMVSPPTKANCVPSGDHDGLNVKLCGLVGVYSSRRFVPSERITNKPPSSCAKAIWDPSGDHEGSPTSFPPRSLMPVPSLLITYSRTGVGGCPAGCSYPANAI